jgi:hypothetical protein
MTHHWDEFSKSLAEESLPRRETLRRLGFLVAGAVLSPLGVGTAWARGPDPCKTFCKCRNKSQQNACLAACNACNKDTSRLAGSCGTYTCCGAGQTNCGRYCSDLANDWNNCGACGNRCRYPGPYEYGACTNGNCEYACLEGAAYCNGFCTLLDWDPHNCGACGNVCPDSAPYCNLGACSVCSPGTDLCGGQCVDLLSDPDNCGACGAVCPSSAPYCHQASCQPCAPGLTLCGDPAYCTDLRWDDFNCGACGSYCYMYAQYCYEGRCWDYDYYPPYEGW